MQIALLIAACFAPAALEWVEISQQHYRKPVRGHAYPEQYGATYNPIEEETRLPSFPEQGNVRPVPKHPTLPVRLTNNDDEDETVQVETFPKGVRKKYSNQSISEHSWTQNAYEVPGNFKLFEADNFKVKANITPQFSLEIYEPVIEDVPELVMRNRLQEQERVSATIERVPSKGSVKRVQLSNTPVKSPSVSTAVSPIRRNDVNKYESTPVDDDLSSEFEIKSDTFKNVQEGVINISLINDLKHIFSTTTPVRNHDRIITSTGWPTSDPSMLFHKHPQTHFTRQPGTQRENNNTRDRIKNSSIKKVADIDENRITDSNIKTKDILTKPPQVNNTIQDKINNNKYTNNEAEEDAEFEEVTTSSNIKNHSNQHKRPPDGNANISKDQSKPNEEIKVSTMENVMKFMKVVAQTISKNTKRGVNGKVKYLSELKDTLLNSIKERIDATWPDDASLPARRRSRSATARGHMEFPSSESALMTISFLTFAVFLIKLVLQVIQTYKNKAMMVAPLVVATGGRAVRKLRSFL